MFDILVYLFENYYQTDLYPDQDALARKLSAAGFERDDISDALVWLRGLSTAETSSLPHSLAQNLQSQVHTSLQGRFIASNGSVMTRGA